MTESRELPLLGKSLVMIADDSPTSVRILKHQLEKKYQTVIATNGRETLDMAERILPDLILLDVLMPNLDGFEVCAELKSSTATKDIPVIFLTGLDKTQDIVKGFQLGTCDYVTKPFRAEE